MTVRKPPPGKGYDLQREYTEGLDPFWFRWADQWWELPHLKMLDFEKQLDVLAMQDAIGDIKDAESMKAKMNEVFAMLMGETQNADWVKVDRPIQALYDLLDNWRSHSEVTEEDQGESSASDGSSKASTRRPSSATSKASTGSGSRKRSTPRAAKTATPRAKSSSVSGG
jgi:hypothetical protein